MRHIEKVIEALLSEPTQRAAAAHLGVSTRSLQRWQRHSAFQQEFQRVKSTLLAQTVGKLHSDSANAAHTLAAMVSDESVSPAQRIAASGRLLELMLKAAEYSDLSRRIEILEAAMKGDD